MSQTLESGAERDDGPSGPRAGPGRPRTPRRTAAGRTVGPLLAYAVPHALTMAIALLLVTHLHKSVGHALGGWDSGFYAQVARQGYERRLIYRPDGRPTYMGIAFFPLLPILMKAVALPTGLTFKTAGIIVNLVLGPIAGLGIFAALRTCLDRGTALMVAALWASVPPSYVQSMAYSDVLLTALSAWALYALLTKRWLTTGVLTILAGLTRFTAVVLIATVIAAAGVEIVRGPARRRPAAAAVLAPLGILAFFGYLWAHTGVFDAWFVAERATGWSSSFDFGHQTYERVRGIATLSALHSIYWFPYLLAFFVVVAASVSAVLVSRDRRLPWPLTLWTLGGVALILLTAGSFSSKARFMMPLFVLLVPAASALVRTRRGTRYGALGAACVLGGWFGAYFMVVSKIAP